MASTYTSDINIELIGTGEQAGSWGSTTNQNWQRVDEAISAYASVPIDKDDAEYTWALANTTDAFTDAAVGDGNYGSSGRAAFVEFTNSGGASNVDCAITIQGDPGASPRRVFYARNSLTGGAKITFDVGGNEADEKFILLNGATALIYTKLAGTAVENEVHNGFGTVQANGAVLGTGSADATITTNGANDLILSTNDTLANSSKITIEDTTSGNILLTTSTSGKVKVDNVSIDANTVNAETGNLNLSTTSGDVVLDGVVNVAAGVITGATSITSTDFVGDLTGNADTVTTNANLTGDITSVGNATSIASGVIVDADIKSDAAISISKTALVGGTGLTLSTNTLNVDASQTQITSVGDLNAGSITSGFTGIDVGTGPIDGGIITADTGFAGPLTGNVTGSSTKVIMTSATTSLVTNFLLMGVSGVSSTGTTTPNTSTAFTYTPSTGVLTGATEISAKASDALTLKGTGVTITPSINTNIDCNTTGTGYVDVNQFKLNNAGSHSVTPITSTTYGESYLIGEEAGGGIASGAQGGGMICIGDNAGRSMTSGTQRSVFIGNESGYESTKTNTGHSCIGIGYQSLKHQSGTPSGNIGIGYAAVGGVTAAAASTTGGFNVGIGYTTLSGLTSGVGNVQVGRAGTLSPTSGSGNTLIGNQAKSSLATVDSEIVIGELCEGQGTNTVTIGKGGTDSITTNYVTDGGTWASTSDVALKKNISDSLLGLTFINALRPVTFNFKQREDLDGSEPDEIRAAIDPRDDEGNPLSGRGAELISGFIAQEVKAALDASGTPSVANSAWSKSSTGIERLALGQLVTPLVKAVQELSTKLDSIDTRLAALE